jgi:uncharacterized repeat protein (TIGR03803 family)
MDSRSALVISATRGAVIAVAAAVAFALTPVGSASASYTLTTLHGFCAKTACADGSQSESSVVTDSAGNLYGATVNGGVYGSGTIFELAFDGTRYSYKVLYSFCSQSAGSVSCTDGAFPYSNLILDTSGNLYGTTEGGGGAEGQTQAGTVFKLVPNADHTKWTYKEIYDFCVSSNCSDGSSPFAGLTYAGQASGALYNGTSALFGTTTYGGAHNSGTTYKLVLVQGPVKRKEQVLHDFCGSTNCPDGAVPFGLVADAKANLFGVTQYGGGSDAQSINSGVLYELVRKNSYTERVLHTFCSQAFCADGSSPIAAPAFDSRSRLIGTTYSGGQAHGLVYRLSPRTAQFTVLYDFCSESGCADGEEPHAGVMLDANDNVFGTTAYGGSGANCTYQRACGTVWRLHNGKLTVLYSFCSKANCGDGTYPYGDYSGLVRDASGDLFGTTSYWGPNGDGSQGGTVFELTP